MKTIELQKMTASQIAETLNGLVETCVDGEKGFAEAAADARDPELKSFFQTRSQERAAFVAALQSEVIALGRFAENQGTARGTLHRVWTAAREGIEGHRDRLVLDECDLGERTAKRVYEKALNEMIDRVPPLTRQLVQNQYQCIEASLASIVQRRPRAS
ncbi:MAG: family four-helix-bundle protein [Myxococcaceae bacterium]|jgi:uncharacterized protein (TIGR02284 family)|nr:family four-helix-bundle protein [Myxococcaceae bacterium]